MDIVVREYQTVLSVIEDKTCPLSVVFQQLVDSYLLYENTKVIFQQYSDGTVFIILRLSTFNCFSAYYFKDLHWRVHPYDGKTFVLSIWYNS